VTRANSDDAAFHARQHGPGSWLLLDARLDAVAVAAAESALDWGRHLSEHEVEVVDSSGGTRIVSMSSVAMPDTDADQSLLVVRDITLEREMRTELAAFAGVVAHDLRTPLAGIDGWTELVEDQLSSGERIDRDLLLEFVTRVRTSTRRMRELIGSLLQHATSSNRRLEPTVVDLEALVADVVASRSAGAQVRFGPLPQIRADEILLRQVIDNLIGNALKYVLPGERPHVMVSARAVSSDRVAVAVTDRGVGLPVGEHRSIFEEFYRAHRDYDGSGLGLAICRRIVLRHGGTIVARDNPEGVGTVFEFTIPSA
jgi:signal transduction histidine kinase